MPRRFSNVPDHLREPHEVEIQGFWNIYFVAIGIVILLVVVDSPGGYADPTPGTWPAGVFGAIAERLDVELAPKRIYRTQLKIV